MAVALAAFNEDAAGGGCAPHYLFMAALHPSGLPSVAEQAGYGRLRFPYSVSAFTVMCVTHQQFHWLLACIFSGLRF